MLLTGYQREHHLEKIKPFDTSLERTMSNFANDRAILKLNNSVLVKKSFPSLHTNFILNLYTDYELNDRPRNLANSFPLKNCLFGTVKSVRDAVKKKLPMMVKE